MLVKFIDEWWRAGCVPYDDIGTIRQDHDGYAIVRCKSGDVITTKTRYDEFIGTYQSAVLEDIEMMIGEEEDDGEDV